MTNDRERPAGEAKQPAQSAAPQTGLGQATVETYRKISTLCLIVLAAVSIIWALIYTKTILVPLVIAIFIFTMMTPVIRYIKYMLRCPKWLATVIVAILFLVPTVLLVVFVVNSVGNFVQTAGTYQSRIVAGLTSMVHFIKENKIPIPQEMMKLEYLPTLVSGPTVTNFLKNFGGMAVKFLSYSVLVLVFVFFLLVGSGSTPKVTNPTLKEIQNKISAYLFVHIAASLLTGFCVGVVYFSNGLELALMFSVMTIILNFIPNLGSVIAVSLPLPIAFMQFGFGPEFWVILIIPSMVQFVIGSILEPKLLGNTMDLHPVTIIGSLIFWALVWGVVGAFLAVPIMAALRIILNRIEPTRPFAEILAGRLPK